MNAHRNATPLFAPAIFLLLALAMFFDVIFSPSRVVSSSETDLAMQFIPWRQFGFSQLREGNLPLWNPYIYGGAPYFAGFQSALLYPPNWLHLFLPVGLAINWIVALHVFAAGYFTYLWCRSLSVGTGGSILAGVMFMFCGPYFLHLYAGHLPHLAVMVWTPLMLLSVDRLAQTADPRWAILGIIATSLHILAGHPQYVYYTAMAMGIYTCLRLIGSQHRLSLIAGLPAMYAGAVLVTAIQLFAGIQAAGESVRSGGTPYEFASTFSLPPQNFITLLAPTFFGNMQHYWGAGYLWEMCLFVSITGLVLAVLGVFGRGRQAWPIVIILAVMIIFALGRHTPLYRLMYDLLPGYNSFRGTVKFAYLAALFAGLLAGMGLDWLLKNQRVSWKWLTGPGVAAVVLAIAGGWIRTAPPSWAHFVQWVDITAEQARELFIFNDVENPEFVARTARESANVMFLAAGTMVATGLLLWASRFHRLVPYSLLILAALELFIFARSTRETMNLAEATKLPQAWREALAALDSHTRVLTVPLEYANAGMSLGFENLAGYDPGILRRYAELFFASQDADPATANQYLPIKQIHQGIFRMLRCRLVCLDPDRPPLRVADPLPQALVVSDWVQIQNPRNILNYMVRSNFDAASTVVLEEPPDVQTIPAASPPGQVQVLAQTTDSLELKVHLNRPAILVVTNNYSKGWRVVPLKTGQQHYRVMAANYTQIGVPLQAGEHHFILEYSPLAFRVGRWVSIASLAGLPGAWFLFMPRTRRFR